MDGDTVWVRRAGRRVKIRLIGINTPETVDPRRSVQCYGPQASARAKQLLTGTRVYLAGDPSQDRVDRYGRELDYLWLASGPMFNLLMVRDGFALEYTYDRPYRYKQQFRAAQQQARQHGAGLWSPSTCRGDITRPATADTASR